jgi:hypothetical protein
MIKTQQLLELSAKKNLEIVESQSLTNFTNDIIH